jgi:hypothetical protein
MKFNHSDGHSHNAMQPQLFLHKETAAVGDLQLSALASCRHCSRITAECAAGYAVYMLRRNAYSKGHARLQAQTKRIQRLQSPHTWCQHQATRIAANCSSLLLSAVHKLPCQIMPRCMLSREQHKSCSMALPWTHTRWRCHSGSSKVSSFLLNAIRECWPYHTEF